MKIKKVWFVSDCDLIGFDHNLPECDYSIQLEVQTAFLKFFKKTEFIKLFSFDTAKKRDDFWFEIQRHQYEYRDLPIVKGYIDRSTWTLVKVKD